MKGRWIDTRHGKDGVKIYELFDENMDGELIKGGMQEWMCDKQVGNYLVYLCSPE